MKDRETLERLRRRLAKDCGMHPPSCALGDSPCDYHDLLALVDSCIADLPPVLQIRTLADIDREIVAVVREWHGTDRSAPLGVLRLSRLCGEPSSAINWEAFGRELGEAERGQISDPNERPPSRWKASSLAALKAAGSRGGKRGAATNKRNNALKKAGVT